MSAGVFRRHGRNGEVLADPGRAVFFNCGEPYRVSHPIDGGDVTTMLSFSREPVADAVARRDPRAKEAHGEPVVAFPAEDAAASVEAYALVQRLRRVAREPRGREIEIEESALAVLDAAVAQARGAPASAPRSKRPDAAAERRRRAAAVREVLAERLAGKLTLDVIAREVGVSPFHLARLFREETGLPIHRYLNRLRLRVALARVSADGGDLLGIALDSGFSSHAHFTDAFRREFGLPPSRFRLAPSPRELAKLRKILEA